MDALSSISPFSKNPESRQGAGGLAVPHFSMEPWLAPEHYPHPHHQEIEPQAIIATHEPLTEGCSLVCGPASTQAVMRVSSLLIAHPSIATSAKIWRDERGAPLQALPALVCAAIQGADPEGWTPVLANFGACFDSRVARAEARSDMVGMPGPRGGKLADINARCDALSLWTLACAEASHPHSAIRAIESIRKSHSDRLAPLSSELGHFSDPVTWDKPDTSPKARAGAFVEAAKVSDGFCDQLLPLWSAGPRGLDLALIAEPIAEALSLDEALRLSSALANIPNAPLGTLILRDATLKALSHNS